MYTEFYFKMASISKSYLRLRLFEVELLCSQFSKCFDKNSDEVLKFGISHFIKEHNISLDDICLSKSEINKYTIPKLKDELKLRNLAISGKKNELVTRLVEYIEKLKTFN